MWYDNDKCCYRGLMTKTLLSLEVIPTWTCFGVKYNRIRTLLLTGKHIH